ncbi:MAG: ParB/RepB/Spo0J family partition protein [Nitriliruptorales bacterium]|nr:ParB/RepB/Spo0J family partition protein [Nitriliruptorales bacterium]
MRQQRAAGLGRGLNALIPAATGGHSGLLTLRLSEIQPNPRQPRGQFDERGLEELAHSLRDVGMLQPIVVRPTDGGRFQIIAGERRVRAARLAGLEQVPAVVRTTQDGDLLTEALVENIHRADLNPLEEAAAFQQLLDDFGVTHDQLAGKLGKSRPAISNALRLLTLPAALQEHVSSGALSAGHARALLAVDDPNVQARIGRRVIAEGLSVRATEALVRALTDDQSDAAAQGLAASASQRTPSPYAHLQRTLTDALATSVAIKGTPARGRVVIDYAGPEDLQRLLDVLAKGAGIDLTDA